MKNLAIIGYGGMGAYHHERLSKLNLCHIVGGYDIDPKRCELMVKNGLKSFGGYKEIAADKSIDAVLIATPNDIHPFYAEYFAAANKDILCEKPVANTSKEFEAMLKAATNNGVMLTVHQNRRWDKDYLIAKEVMASGKIGKAYRVESRVGGSNGIPGGWRKLPNKGGGMMLDWGVHLIDQLVYDNPVKIVSIECKYSYILGFDVDDGFDLTLTFENGFVAYINVDTNNYIPLPRWQVYGRDGTATIRDWDCNGEIITPNYSNDVEIVGINAGNGFTKTMAYRPHDSVNSAELPKIIPNYDELYRKFFDGVQAVDNSSVMRVLKIMEAAKLSSDTNTIIKGEF